MISFSFRVMPPHPDDAGKSCIRIGREQMKRLGVSSGDILLVTGITPTRAVCLPMGDQMYPHDPEFEYLDDQGRRLPPVRLSNVVLQNIRGYNMLPIVRIGKAVSDEMPLVEAGIPKLSGLKRTIRIGKKISSRRLEITLESIAVYENCFRIFLDIKYSFDDPEQWVESRIYATILASDDKGRRYACMRFRNEQSQWSLGSPQHSKISCIMMPSLSENTTRLCLGIDEVTWRLRERKDLQFLDQVNLAARQEQSIVSVWQQQKSYYMIATGPWNFDVGLR